MDVLPRHERPSSLEKPHPERNPGASWPSHSLTWNCLPLRILPKSSHLGSCLPPRVTSLEEQEMPCWGKRLSSAGLGVYFDILELMLHSEKETKPSAVPATQNSKTSSNNFS